MQQFFVPNFQGYDLLIHLKPKFNPLSSVKVTANGEAHNVDKNGKNFSLVPIVDFNPVEIYLAELRVKIFNVNYAQIVQTVWCKETLNNARKECDLLF